MELICACKVCGHTDDWCETSDKNHFFCQNCHTESHKGSMKLVYDFYGEKFPQSQNEENK